MKYFNEEDYLMFQEEAKKLGFDLVKREDSELMSEYDDINILNYFCLQYDFSKLGRYNLYSSIDQLNKVA